MRIPDWTPALKPQPNELIDAIAARRGGSLIALDKALLWSEPLARGWNVFLKGVRTEFSASRKLCELGICTVAVLTGAHYEYHHHAPVFLAAGGTQAQLDAVRDYGAAGAAGAPGGAVLDAVERLVVEYAARMTRDVKVSDTLFAAVRAHFDETQIIELTATIAAYNMVARVLVALQIEPEH